MGRYFTMRRYCRRCRVSFVIASSNHWFCDNVSCVKARRKERREELKALRAKPGSDEHLAQAVRSGD